MRVNMPKLSTIAPRIGAIDTRSAPPPPKTAEPYLLTPAHRAWRAKVIDAARDAAGNPRCQWATDGVKCNRSEPRMFADHVHERSDGGHPQGEGMCLCGKHHTIKTIAERAKRMRS